MALVVMRSAYSPVVRDTMDYSTALCDRDGELVAQGLTLAVQLGTFPTVHAARPRALRRGHRARRRLPRQRPVRLRRPAPAGPLRDPADLPRRRARGVRGDDGASRRRRRPHARVDRRARDRDLPGGAAAAAAQALRGRPREHERDPDHREEHAPADRGDRRPAGPDRGLPRGRARPDRDPRAVRHAREPPLHGRAAAAQRAPDARRARGAARRRLRVRGLHRRVRRRAGAAADRGRADGARRRGVGRPRGDGAAGGGGAQLPGRHGQRRRLLRVPRHRRPRDPERGRLHAADPHQRAGRHDRQPGAARGLRRPRRRRLPRLRRRHGRARPGRAGQGDRAGRGRADADRDRRLPGREPVRPDGGARRLLGRAGGAATGSRACRTRSPTCRTSRSSWSRATCRCGCTVTGSSPTRAAPGASAAGSPTSAPTSCWPTRRC